LLAGGLIDKTRQGWIAALSKLPSLYRFTDEPMYEWPKLGIRAMSATCEYKQFDSLRAAKSAISEALLRRAREKPKLRNPKLLTPKSEAMGPLIASEIEQGHIPKLRSPKLSNGTADDLKANQNQHLNGDSGSPLVENSTASEIEHLTHIARDVGATEATGNVLHTHPGEEEKTEASVADGDDRPATLPVATLRETRKPCRAQVRRAAERYGGAR
jgi:hypothetical protein